MESVGSVLVLAKLYVVGLLETVLVAVYILRDLVEETVGSVLVLVVLGVMSI